MNSATVPKGMNSLSEQSQQALQSGMLVTEVNKNTASEYHMGYVYRLVTHSPEVVMAVFTNYADQKDYITNVLTADVEAQSANYCSGALCLRPSLASSQQ